MRSYRCHKKSVTCVALSPDDSTFFSSSKDGNICSVDIETGKKMVKFFFVQVLIYHRRRSWKDRERQSQTTNTTDTFSPLPRATMANTLPQEVVYSPFYYQFDFGDMAKKWFQSGNYFSQTKGLTKSHAFLRSGPCCSHLGFANSGTSEALSWSPRCCFGLGLPLRKYRPLQRIV